MFIMIDEKPEETPVEWGGNPVEKNDAVLGLSNEDLDESFDLIWAKTVIKKLEIACDKALLLRGLWSAINDPLSLEGEKIQMRERYQKIEAEIRAAICEAENFRRGRKINA